MKELKKISLKEEVDKEAIQIEKEVMDRKDLDNISVSEEMETSLFNKIQDYEYDRRSKTVHRRKKKRYAVLALAAVLILVFGSTMTSVGSKPYWKVLWDRIAGDEKASIINVDNMESYKTVTFEGEFKLKSGNSLPRITLAYETYGTLNEDGSNVIFIFHALTGDSHVASHGELDSEGWWESAVGPGKAYDTNKYFVI